MENYAPWSNLTAVVSVSFRRMNAWENADCGVITTRMNRAFANRNLTAGAAFAAFERLSSATQGFVGRALGSLASTGLEHFE